MPEEFAPAFAFMEHLLDLCRRRGAEGEVYWTWRETLPVRFQAGHLKRVERARHQVLALRALRGGRVGLTSTTVAREPGSVVERALAAARHGPHAEFAFPGETPGSDQGEWWDERVACLAEDVMLDWGRHFVARVEEVSGALAHAHLARRTTFTRLLNTSGLDAGYRKTTLAVEMTAEVTEEGNFLYVEARDASTRLDLDVPALAAQVVQDLQAARRNVTLSPGRYPVVLAPQAVRDLLGPVLACADGRAVARGISPWRGRLGERLFHPSFTLVDDGRRPDGPASGLCDDEGVARRSTPIIAGGVLRSFLLDLESAAALQLSPTGNAVRPVLADGPPLPKPTNLVIPPGQVALADMLGSVREGVLVESFMGAWSGNLYAGVVTGNVALGYRLRGGERVGRVKDCMFSVNAFEALHESLAGVSQETRRLGELRFPYLLVERATISTSGRR